MNAREGFPISELTARTNVPAATIHHYLRQGLIPQPKRVGVNRFLYDERHVRALTLIRLLRERRRLPLPTIKRLLPDLLALEEDEAFRPEMWDRVSDIRLASAQRRSPRNRLVQAASDAFAKRGFADVNVDDLCRTARIAKGSFYRHYRSKEELFVACVDAAADDVVAQMERHADAGAGAGALVEALERALEPRLPLFMELFTRATQRRPVAAAAARRIFSDLAYRVGATAGGPDAMASGAWMLGLAAASAFRRALEPSPLAAVDILRAIQV
ncbi:MAG TPA: MerR family transcriptional regulator [Actinomycetota bacterium]|jgi:AcrR family transcriptional regulator